MPWLGAGRVLVCCMGWFSDRGGERERYWGWWGETVGGYKGVAVVMVGVVGGVVVQVVLRRWMGRGRGEACFWSGYAGMVWVSWESVGVVVGMGSVRAGGMGIWYVL